MLQDYQRIKDHTNIQDKDILSDKLLFHQTRQCKMTKKKSGSMTQIYFPKIREIKIILNDDWNVSWLSCVSNEAEKSQTSLRKDL